MNKIATHDSATGEKGKGFLSFLVSPFAKTQSKSIQEQYDAGCRSFDIRVREDELGVYRCAHGLWMSKRNATEILSEINSFPEPCQVVLLFKSCMFMILFKLLFVTLLLTCKHTIYCVPCTIYCLKLIVSIWTDGEKFVHRYFA